MHLEFVTTARDLGALRDDWNRLAGDHPLRRWEWFAAWWDAFGDGGELAICVVRNGERIVAIAPWFTDSRNITGRSLRFLGSGKACTDYQTILVERQFQTEAFALLFSALQSPPEGSRLAALDLIEFDGVSGDDTAMRQFFAELARQDHEVTSREIESSWVVALSPSFDEFENELSKQMRRKVKKAVARLRTPEITYHHAREAADFERIWPLFVSLHQQRFQNRAEDAGCFSDNRFETFLKRAACDLMAAGRAEIHWVEEKGEPFAAQLYLLGDRTAYMYQSGFDPARSALEPGHLLYTGVFRELIRRGLTRVDFLRGNEPYKAMWNALPTSLYRFRSVPPRWMPRLRSEAIGATRSLKRMLKNVLGISTT